MADSKKTNKPDEKKEASKTSECNCSPADNTITNKINILFILIIGLLVFNGYLFFEVQGLKKGAVAGAATGETQEAEQESPLSVQNLKTYAADLKLDTNKFNTCLEEDKMAEQVSKDLSLGQEYGVQGTPGFFINGKFLGGAFPFENFKEIIDKEIEGTATGLCTDYSEELQKYCETEDGPFKPAPQNIEVPADTPVMGNPDAPITMIEFSDFECPYCARGAETVKNIREAYPDQVKIYFMQFPLTNMHPNAQKAAEASLCAAEQGKFEEYHDMLFGL